MDGGDLVAYGLFAVIAIGLVVMSRVKAKGQPPTPRLAEELARAHAAQGTVLRFTDATSGDMDTQRVQGDLREINVQVHVDGEPDYITTVVWQVQHGHAARLEEGMSLPVRVYRERRDILFPAVDWIEMRETDFWEARSGKRQDETIRPRDPS